MPKLAANLSLMFTEVNFLDRFAAAAAAGFDGVEFLFPYDFAPAEIAARLKQYGSIPGAIQLAAGRLGERRARHGCTSRARERIHGWIGSCARIRAGNGLQTASRDGRKLANGSELARRCCGLRGQSAARRRPRRGTWHHGVNRAPQQAG